MGGGCLGGGVVSAMVLHKDKQVNLGNGAIRFTTLCNRMNKRCSDGMNIADADAEVTCKFCLARMDRGAQ